MDGNHAEYLNMDYNLGNLDLLVLAETKLDQQCSTQRIQDKLKNWNIFNRYDSDDGSKHMGLLLLTSKKSSILDQFLQEITRSISNNQLDYILICR